MSIINSQPLIGASGQGGYFLTKSLRFRSSASAYLQRSFSGSQTDSKKATVSFWFKLGQIGNTSTSLYPTMMGGVNDAETIGRYIGNLRDNNNFTMQIGVSDDGNFLETTQVFRDPSAWYHLVVSFDSTQATASNRVKVYLNGNQITAFSTANYPSQNSAFVLFRSTNSNNRIGGQGNGGAYFDGYMTEINSVDGQALTPSSFGETDPKTGVWIPKKYTGTYGNWGFYLDFKDTSSVAALGYDAAGSNDWTVNNVSLTSGATYDSMKDVPTLTDTDTANYPTLNPLDTGSSATITNGNLSISGGDNVRATMACPTTGKWYFEYTKTNAQSGDNYAHVSVFASSANIKSSSTGSMFYRDDGGYYENASLITTWASYTTNDVIGVTVDADAQEVKFYKNNSLQGTKSFVSQIASSQAVFGTRNNTGQTADVNFGQRPFAYTPPTGFKALNTFNLPTPTIGATASSQANKYFDATLYTGTGSAQSITNSGSMQPDLVWVKGRDAAKNHTLVDSVRGATKNLVSNSTNDEGTWSSITAFNSNGFTLGTDANENGNGNTFVAWQWKANGTGSSNTAGSITSTVSVNTTAGFSVVTYTGNGVTGATVGHGLGIAPSMIIVKRRSSTSNWNCYHASLGATKYIVLNLTDASYTDIGAWNNAAPTSSVFTLGSFSDLNTNGSTMVAYCFAQVAGYSAFGSYTGNGSSDGTFVYTGFRPAFVLVKRSDGGTSGWFMFDRARDTFNVVKNRLQANSSGAEANDLNAFDFLSNGFKLRDSDTAWNVNGGTYIYMAFAENPFKFSNAR